MDHRSQVEDVKKTLLILGLDDWVDFTEAVDVARDVKAGRSPWKDLSPGSEYGVEREAMTRGRQIESEREALPLAVEAIKELVRDGLVRVSNTTRNGFIAWDGSAREVEMRIDEAVKNVRYPMVIGDLFWLENTPAGNRLGQEAFRATPEAWSDGNAPQ